MLNYFGLSPPGDGVEGTLLQSVLNGGPPPPPPSAGASRIALRDGAAYSPEVPIDGAPLPSPMGPDDPPLAIRDVRPVKKPQLKPKIKNNPPAVPKLPILILDPPPRKRHREADEILRILGDITDSEPKRAKRAIADLPIPGRNRLRIVPA